ncbi:MAG: Aminodeoxychorismate lyase [Candidatus Moranbacteria bacterium GW2011_GWA2_39_41]|nr:MAG: Aminodeoxychorismate lyase [Candidatus Moranbacteria bacterium GW2011_GWA2_39_41]
MKKISIALIVIAITVISGFFYVRSQVYFSHGAQNQNSLFEIKKGEGNAQIATNLEDKGMITGKIYFWFYLKTHNLLDKIYPGEYLLNGNMTIPEIAVVITNPKKVFEQVLFKEGWTAAQMAWELQAHGFDGKAFLEIVNKPLQDLISQFSVLSDKPKAASLEGYLFPDTYYFAKEATPEGIVKKILNNTEIKFDNSLRAEIKKQNKAFFDVLIVASIVEREVSTEADRALVSGLFWNRLNVGQALQSDATLSYILNDKEDAHSLAQTKIDSPYNTYANKGLPIGPVANPGLSAIKATIYPKDSPYNYFLSDPKTGQTIFSATFPEHVANKSKYGL